MAFGRLNAEKRKFLPIIFLLTFFILISGIYNFNQALMIKLSLKKLTEGADAIIQGEVIEIKSQWSMDRSIILTIATLQIHEILKGNINNNQILIQYPGGEVGDIGLKVSDMPSFHLKERVLVFLKSITSLADTKHSPVIALNVFPAFSVFGVAQGKYSIDEDGMAQKSGYVLISKDDEREASLPLADLKARIKSILKQNFEKTIRTREKIKR